MSDFFPLPDYHQIKNNFLTELTRASQNQTSSLHFIQHTFPKKPLIQEGIIQAFVIGGTNYEETKARIFPDGTRKEIPDEHKTGKVPQFSEKETFLNFIKAIIDPTVDAIAINFAYPIAPTKGSFGEIDGMLLYGTKENVFAGLLNQPIGNLLKDVTGFRKPITIVNDTVSLGQHGLVVGSGFNICVNSTNLEAGNFNAFTPTEELEMIDNQSNNKGFGRFEKMLSGNYLPLQYNLLSQKYHLDMPKLVNGKELSKLAQIDKNAPGDLARALLERSARLVAAAVAGTYEFSKKERLIFQTDGSLFWNGWEYKNNVKNELSNLGVAHHTITFFHLENIAMKGALNLVTRTQ